MSNPIRYDSLLVRALAAELGERFSGKRIRSLRLAPGKREFALELDRDAILFLLHPTRGHILTGGPPAAEQVLRFPRKCGIARVEALPDERILSIELFGTPPDQPRRVILELLTNQWNAVVLDAAGRIVAVLWKRQSGARQMRPGARYELPPPAAREGLEAPIALDRWHELLDPVDPADRRRTLLDAVAYASPLNVDAILGRAAEPALLGAAAGADPLDAAHVRYLRLVAGSAGPACLVEMPHGWQPYPAPLSGSSYREAPSLLDAFALAGAEAGVAAPGGGGIPPELLGRLRERIEHDEARMRRLRAEIEGAAAEAESLRRIGDLLLAALHSLQRGMSAAEVPDFEGGTVLVELDPTLSPAENATAYYERGRRRGKAADRIPRLLRRLEEELRASRALLERAEQGAATAEEVAGRVGPEPVTGGAAAGAPLPYRRYTTSGKLEVRVGRSGAANDDLTFRHSSPNDIWLHARDVSGAHVILRWADANANPPGRDLAEAAVLAALSSRARTSGVVAVDWTRRKYVRKPRKAAPGAVLPDRVKTIFVEPDPAVERRMRGEEEEEI